MSTNTFCLIKFCKARRGEYKYISSIFISITVIHRLRGLFVKTICKGWLYFNFYMRYNLPHEFNDKNLKIIKTWTFIMKSATFRKFLPRRFYFGISHFLKVLWQWTVQFWNVWRTEVIFCLIWLLMFYVHQWKNFWGWC